MPFGFEGVESPVRDCASEALEHEGKFRVQGCRA